MNPLQNLLARAEANARARAAAVASLAASRAVLKEAEDSAKRDHRQALGAVARLRGALEAIQRLPEAGEILADGEPAADTLTQLGLRAGSDDEPVLVEMHEPDSVVSAMPFTPALDYPDAHPVEPPVAGPEIERLLREGGPVEALVDTPNIAPVPLTPGMLDAVTKPPIPVAKPAPAEAARPARPNAGKVSALADDIMAMFQKVRHGSTASLQFEAIYKDTGKAMAAVDRALKDLVERKLIRRVKTAEKGHVTVFITDAAAGIAA